MAVAPCGSPVAPGRTALSAGPTWDLVALRRDLDPAATTGLLIVLAELALHEGIQVRRKLAASATSAVGVAGALALVATKVGVDRSDRRDADLVDVSIAAADLDPNPLLRVAGSHGHHLFCLPYGDWFVG